MKKTFAKTLLVLLVAGLTNVSWAGGREKLNEFFTQVDTMQASFTQQVVDDKEKVRQSSSGTVFLSRPGKFRWEYTSPNKNQIVSDGKNVWVYDIDLDQVTVKPVKQALSAAPVGLLLQKQPAEKQFAVDEMEADGSNLEWFRLTPHKKDSDFTNMDLGISDNGIQEMILNDKFGQKTYIKFSGMNTNGGIDDSKFSFTPPKGADVIGNPS